MNPDGSAGDFDTVDHRVISLRAQPAKQFRPAVYRTVEHRQVFVQRRGERMMHRIVPAVIFVILEHRELSNPQRREHSLRNQFLAARDFVA